MLQWRAVGAWRAIPLAGPRPMGQSGGCACPDNAGCAQRQQGRHRPGRPLAQNGHSPRPATRGATSSPSWPGAQPRTGGMRHRDQQHRHPAAAAHLAEDKGARGALADGAHLDAHALPLHPLLHLRRTIWAQGAACARFCNTQRRTCQRLRRRQPSHCICTGESRYVGWAAAVPAYRPGGVGDGAEGELSLAVALGRCTLWRLKDGACRWGGRESGRPPEKSSMRRRAYHVADAGLANLCSGPLHSTSSSQLLHHGQRKAADPSRTHQWIRPQRGCPRPSYSEAAGAAGMPTPLPAQAVGPSGCAWHGMFERGTGVGWPRVAHKRKHEPGA